MKKSSILGSGLGVLLLATCASATRATATPPPAAPAAASEAPATRYSHLKQVYDVAIQATDTETRSARMTHVLNVAAYHLGMTPLEDLHLTAADRGETAPRRAERGEPAESDDARTAPPRANLRGDDEADPQGPKGATQGRHPRGTHHRRTHHGP